MSTEIAYEAAERLEKELGLPANFFNEIHKQDDWSFIIKMHAIFEAAATYILSHRTRNRQLKEIFSKIELSNKKTAKIAFIKAYEILDSEERGYISMLSELRNLLIHNIENVNFSIESHISKMDPNQKKKFVKYAGYGYPDTLKIAERNVSKSQFVIENPKLALWQTGVSILGIMYITKEIETLKQQTEEYARKALEYQYRSIKEKATF